MDWNISEKDRFFARYSESYFTNPTVRTISFSTTASIFIQPIQACLDWTRSVSPTLVNEARAGVNYVFINNGSSSNGLTGFAQTVGIPDVPSSFLPAISLSGGNVAASAPATSINSSPTRIHYEDTMILTKGNHTMHFGFQGYRYRVDTFYSGNNGRAGTIQLQRAVHFV